MAHSYWTVHFYMCPIPIGITKLQASKIVFHERGQRYLVQVEKNIVKGLLSFMGTAITEGSYCLNGLFSPICLFQYIGHILQCTLNTVATVYSRPEQWNCLVWVLFN
jgi:hypothetical protein